MATDVFAPPRGLYPRVMKPLLDRAVGLVLAILTLPVVVVLLLVSWTTFGWPPLSPVSRRGRGHRRFNLYRVNTRRDYHTDLRGPELRRSRFLRATSLDELPQLWNVVLGHMSLVGPRPMDPVDAIELGPAVELRHAVRPGLTGRWQLEARGDGRQLAEHLATDVGYIEDMSFFTDLGILLRTIPTLIRRREDV